MRESFHNTFPREIRVTVEVGGLFKKMRGIKQGYQRKSICTKASAKHFVGHALPYRSLSLRLSSTLQLPLSITPSPRLVVLASGAGCC